MLHIFFLWRSLCKKFWGRLPETLLATYVSPVSRAIYLYFSSCRGTTCIKENYIYMYINLYYVHLIPSDTQNAFYSSSTCVESLSFHHCVIDVLVDDGFGAVLAQGDKWIPKKGGAWRRTTKQIYVEGQPNHENQEHRVGVFVWKWCIPHTPQLLF